MDSQSVKNIVKLLGIIGLCISLFFLIPILVGIFYHEDVFFFAIFDIFFFIINFLIFITLRKHRINLSIRDGILSVNLVWILVGFAGAVPLWLYGKITFMQGIFESISGFTTTGATIFADIENLPHMILILRSLMHWVGGLGILVFGVGLLSLINPSGSLTLFKAESSGIRVDKTTPKIKDTSLMLWGIYLVLTVVDAVLLKLGGMTSFDAFNHALSTISTGGFSTKDLSLAAYSDSGFILWTTTIFMMLSGITFIAHLRMIHGDFNGYKNEETKWYIIIFIVLSIFLTCSRYCSSDDSFYFSFTHATFSVASLMTTTGFASVDYETWGPMAVSLSFLAMLASGNGGSTAGGVKIIRYVISFKVIFAELEKILHPKAIVRVFINDSPVSNSIITLTFGFIILFVITNSILIFYLYESGHDMMTSVSASMACIGNIGPGFAAVGPSHNYSIFSSIDLLALSFGMILGRLEIFTFLLMFIPSFWKRF